MSNNGDTAAAVGMIGVVVLYVAIIIAIVYGWVMNLITLLSTPGYDTVPQIIVGAIGVIAAPIGALVYYIAG